MNHPNSLSFWERESFLKDIDVAIIGCGIVGLSTALSLRERYKSLRIAIIERGALPEGASTRNAGFACFGSITELMDDLETTSPNEVFALVEKRYRGLLRLRQRVGDAHMSYEPTGGFEIFKHTEGDVLESCMDMLSYFNKNVAPIVGRADNYQVIKQDFGFKNVNDIKIWNTTEGLIDSGRTMQRLLQLAYEKNIVIFNGLKIKDLHNYTEGVILESEDGWSVNAKKVVVATNGFAWRLMPHLAVKPARNQVLITEPLPHVPFKGGFHYDKGYFYFRNVGNRILLGGGRHLALEEEMTDAFGHTELIQKNLIRLLQETILPNQSFNVDMWWSGIMGIGSVKKPIIQHVAPNIIVAVRMGGMGVAIGSLVGEEAADLVDI
ncbi:MAG: FAD-binding oxidoreductase [Saprospiraceae bacterium]|nr:FAD-binding oxidoreductase [Saprospiraceae bacterium]